jgi:t-SNARE complex subunit (syntaxin)
MLRQQYQEKFVKKQKNIKSLNDEIKEVFYLFEELEEEVKKSQTGINTIEDNIEDNIETIKEELNETEESVNIAKIEKERNIISLYTILGGGFGSFIIAYNPYFGIGGIVGGMFIGSVIGYFK